MGGGRWSYVRGGVMVVPGIRSNETLRLDGIPTPTHINSSPHDGVSPRAHTFRRLTRLTLPHAIAMSGATTTHDSRHRVQVVGRPTTAGATVKALAGFGPLMVADDHVLARLLPDAFDRTTHAPAVAVDRRRACDRSRLRHVHGRS